MSRFVILSLALIALINSSNIPRTTATTPPGIKDIAFVLTACSSTKYPIMCYKTLSPYSSIIKSDPVNLCLTALSVNLQSATSASTILSSSLIKVAFSPEVLIILKNCLNDTKDTADELKQVVAETMISGNITKAENKRKLETWAMSALTDMTTCMGKFKEVKVNEEIEEVKKAVAELSMTTSNTLSLITRYLHF